MSERTVVSKCEKRNLQQVIQRDPDGVLRTKHVPIVGGAPVTPKRKQKAIKNREEEPVAQG